MKKFIWIMAIVFGFALLGCGLGSGSDNASSPSSYTGGSPEVVTKSSPASEKLTLSDFKPSIKVKTNDCFDGYGCNRTYEVKMSVDQYKLAKDDHSYEVTYVVKGGKEGAQTGTVEIAPDGSYMQFDNMATVGSNDTKLTVKVTEVERLPY